MDKFTFPRCWTATTEYANRVVRAVVVMIKHTATRHLQSAKERIHAFQQAIKTSVCAHGRRWDSTYLVHASNMPWWHWVHHRRAYLQVPTKRHRSCTPPSKLKIPFRLPLLGVIESKTRQTSRGTRLSLPSGIWYGAIAVQEASMP